MTINTRRYIVRVWTRETTKREREGRETMTVGNRVKFRNEIDPGDLDFVWDLIEDNGDRVIIRMACNWTIRPTKVVMKADLVLA